MKILYAIQGTGNGHISRAREIVPLLKQYGELDLLVSGSQTEVSLTETLKYKFHGFSYVVGKKGGIDYWKTVKNMKIRQLWEDIFTLPVRNYDLIINDFEPITAWACKLRNIPTVSLSHQASFSSPLTPRPPKRRRIAELILKYYAPTTHHVGFHFKAYDKFIYTPVIRQEIRDLTPQNHGYYTVYLPAVDDKLLVKYLHQLPDVQWQVFSKNQTTAFQYQNVLIQKIDNCAFKKSLKNCAGLFTGGGFEGPAEALYLGKKLLLMPIKNQFEQSCNAFAAEQLGVPLVKKIDDNLVSILRDWVSVEQKIHLDFPNQTAQIVDEIVKRFASRM
ncbi:glycosyltransferase family protein [Pedobacter arcticus]|uniref:glycosyltransferase family protein n=1 Tax=Pedobacter arcticus TaxID=752140 RepID=UPI00030C3F7B|nr:glycosyltransferase family protein [Pedobacter arcticus]